MTKFDLNKCPRNEQGHYLCQTRDGRPARVVCVDAKGEQPLATLINIGPGRNREIAVRHNPSGAWRISGEPADEDLVNPPVKREGWINIYPDSGKHHVGAVHDTKDAANYDATADRIACIKIEWEE